MPPLLPSPVSDHATSLPKIDPDLEATLSECEKRAMTLDCRTGASVILARSSIFVYGGFTVPLDLAEVNSISVQQELILYFARESKSSGSFQNLGDWISRETFFLDLISRKWERVVTDDGSSPPIEEFADDSCHNKMKERVFHSMCYHDGHLYVFGGLVVSPQSGYELIASNELWTMDLRTKTWKQISSNPSITRRFNHNMHLVPGTEEAGDTLIYIVGGLNNLDRPVHVVDVYNLTQDRWESLDDDSSTADTQEIVTNINGQNTHLVQYSNFSLLIRDQMSNTPLIAMYSPGEGEDDSNISPLVVQPLVPGPNGHRMPVFQGLNGSDRERHKVPFNLQHPSGDYFGHNIIVSGFYPDTQPSNFHCFTYNIPTGKWTEINTVCDDPDGESHRLWQLFVWHSHHKVVLLGTKEAENYLPSVQRFSSIMCIALPMINVFHKAINHTVGRDKSATGSESVSLGNEGFEGYSRYSAPPLEITTISSVFPSHAMALGKDSLELCGQHLSDFEIVTEEGDSVRVPMFLLRKRWGRYFDEVLANGYLKASKDFESRNRHNEFTKLSLDSTQNNATPTTQHFDSTSSKGVRGSSSQGSLDASSTKGETFQASQPLFPLISRKSSPLFFANKPNQGAKSETNDKSESNDKSSPDPQTVLPIHHSKSDSSAICSFNASSKGSREQPHTVKSGQSANSALNKIASSSSGMVFRLPFQEGSGGSALPLPVLQALNNDSSRVEGSEKQLGPPSRRKSSTSSPFMFDGGNSSFLRRASHPAIMSSDDKIIIPTSIPSQSPFCSRKASLTSQNSSISFVSSASDRMGNAAHRRASQDSGMTSSTLNSLSSQIPPPQPMPTEPIPVAPHHSHIDTTASFVSARNSPLSSRRSSLYHELLRPGLNSSVSQSLLGIHESQVSDNNTMLESDPHSIHKRSMDRQILEDNLIDVELEASSSAHKSPLSKHMRQSRQNSYTKASLEGDGSRPSYLSMAESGGSTYCDAIGEFEPLLLPRSLYMPWPTTTIRSFIEFFYTGQVNGKWLLSPVALNLLVMAKLYEIPLLYDLMSEAFYSILGKKEESLLATSETLKHLFLLKYSRAHDKNEDAIKQSLKTHAVYQDFLEFEESLHSIDDGFFDTHLLKKIMRKSSASSSESAGGDGAAARDGKEGTSLNVPILFAGGPRGSYDSVGSATVSAPMTADPLKNSSPKATATRPQKASLGKEAALKNSSQRHLNDYTLDGNVTDERTDKTNRENRAEKMEQQTLSNMSQNENTTYSTQIIEIKQPESSSEDGSDKKKDEHIHQIQTHVDKGNTDPKLLENSTSSSDSDDLGAGFGLASSSKIDKKLRRRGREKPVDPLTKASDSEGSSLKNIIDYFKKGDTLYRPETNTVETLTLASMASANALPPVDYVLELIHETAALVHDVRLIVRCFSVIKLSETLKSLKRQLDHEMTQLDDEARRARTPIEVTLLSPRSTTAKSEDPAFPTPTSSMEKMPRVSSNLSLDKRSPKPNTLDAGPRNTSAIESNSRFASSDQSLSEKSDSASINTRSSKQSSRPPKSKRMNSHLAGSGLTGAAMFMTSSFTPVPSKTKKDTSGSTSATKSGIPFFGKRK
ncbi:LANO_0F08746g1_1 [Lachancea nothofagi CBS 11611]|uniref:LANO_0F08746g1_1 n=1 Tax=Lachancea nothofagi CBS 11611 TaxID=1266666 RepID=A0A1G4K9N8_9SACH|nr:LANO_0F08746g1_1 [Lachancea nothofagi CBS 11611]